MHVKGLHHVQITIPRGAEEEARAFYCGVLGLPEIEKPASLKGRGGFWLDMGTQQLHVSLQDGIERKTLNAHVAYEVDDVAAWRTYLEEHGIVVLDSIAIPHFARFEARDPFGNRFEIIQAVE